MRDMPSSDWTRAEVEAAVADYLDMLACEVRGEKVNKAQRNRFSEEYAESYHLYRLFGFRKTPLLFTLPGDVGRHVQLQPVNYRAQF